VTLVGASLYKNAAQAIGSFPYLHS
jgi:hypothetical protein